MRKIPPAIAIVLVASVTLALLQSSSMAAVGGSVREAFPTAGPVPSIRAGSGSDTGGPAWAYCYVSQAGVQIPSATPVHLCSLTVGPGTWKFSATVSASIGLVDIQTVSIDFVDASGKYYGATTSTAHTYETISIAGLGIGSFSTATVVSLRYAAGGPSSLVASAWFDTGPTTFFLAERLSEAP